MKLGIVSDTHGHFDLTTKAIVALTEHQVDEVIHCGDIGTVEVVQLFADWPTHFVLGNCDYDQHALSAAIEAMGSTFHGRFGSIERDGVRIAFLHSDDAGRFYEETRSGAWDLVCYGHTHQARQHREGDTLVLNPGAVYRANPHSIAVVELPSLEVTSVEI